MFKIKIQDDPKKSAIKDNKDMDDEVERRKVDKNDEKIKSKRNNKNEGKKLEICYFCLKEFDMSKDDLSRYKYGKFPMCDYCAQFYGFYSD